MSARMSIFFFIVLVILPLAAKNKKKQELPNSVLNAHTVAVVIYPDAGEPLTNPMANRTARENVQNAITKWGRLRVVPDAQTADLIVAVQKGHTSGPTIHNSPADAQPVIFDGGVPGAAQHGRSPDLTILLADRRIEGPISATRQVGRRIALKSIWGESTIR